MPTHHLRKSDGSETPREEICLFGQTNFRNQMRRFGIKTDDRRRHMYVIGKTGMGKTTMLENMVLQDIYNGHGIGVVDPHGDFAEKIINYIPPHRINDVVYFNPADVDFPIGFNILEVKNEEQKHLVAAGLMAVFKKIWPDVWSARMEYILNNTLLALLDYEGSTLLGINRLLADKKFRSKVLKKLKDPVIKSFWTNEFANYEPRYQKEAVAPIQNKIGQFLSASVIRNMVAQVKSTINVREIMDTKKIFIMNLSKGRIGEDNSRLLGGMLITEIQLAAMSRVDQPEHERKDFFLYVDEFQNFATPSFANILSEARKYRLSLIMAHQYITQLDEIVADAVFGNVGSMVAFRVGAGDAEFLEKEYAPTFTIEDIVNLPKFQIFLKLMIDGVASQPFSALTMPPIGSPTGSMEKVIRVSRERYGQDKTVIEDKITRWSGMEVDDTDDDGESTTGAAPAPNIKKADPIRSSPKQNERKIDNQSKEQRKKNDEPSQNSLPKDRGDVRREKKSAPSDLPAPSRAQDQNDVVHLSDLSPKTPAADTTPKDLQPEVVPIAPSPGVSSTTIQEELPTPDAPKKRKRKRNRKRKKIGQEIGGQQGQHVASDTQEKTPSTPPESSEISTPEKEVMATPPTQRQDTSPRTLKADEVVHFSDDDDDSWRDDR